jgi:hypothetical protein
MAIADSRENRCFALFSESVSVAVANGQFCEDGSMREELFSQMT